MGFSYSDKFPKETACGSHSFRFPLYGTLLCLYGCIKTAGTGSVSGKEASLLFAPCLSWDWHWMVRVMALTETSPYHVGSIYTSSVEMRIQRFREVKELTHSAQQEGSGVCSQFCCGVHILHLCEWERAHVCGCVCCKCGHAHILQVSWAQLTERRRRQAFLSLWGHDVLGVNLTFKVALEDTCMLLAWGGHRQHLFCTAGNAPPKHSFALYSIFMQKLFIQQELDSSEVLDTWSTKWNRCASWCMHRCVHENQTTVILRIKHNLGLRVYNPFPECWMQVLNDVTEDPLWS